jgi:uncharacterized protein YgbK (DUF1537 family)
VLLGCIADDFTGATDLASMLVGGGMRTVQTIGIARGHKVVADADAVVVALKTRTVPAADAIAQSLAALEWLRSSGARQLYFKYCSTFDSTDQGNIGPVADALMDALGVDFSVACPAFPVNRRTVYLGHLFVGETLLSESPMRHHPLTPMTDANLVRVLGRQTRHKVGLVPYPEVAGGVERIRSAFARLRAEGVRYAVVDAIRDEDLLALGAACADLPLVTGGSGLALGLPENFRRDGRLAPARDAARLPPAGGRAAVLAGSCSEATRRQVAVTARTQPAIAIDPLACPDAAQLAVTSIARARPDLEAGRTVLFYSSAEPGQVAAVQAQLGRERAAALLEAVFSHLAQALVTLGVRRLVIAGGETAGAVVQALGIEALAIGPPIDPGVPWTMSLGEPRIALALKSGNFGGDDFFDRALALMP